LVRLQVGTTEELFATFWKSLTQIVTDELANAARSASALSFPFCVSSSALSSLSLACKTRAARF
jgi:hypothetical protein